MSKKLSLRIGGKPYSVAVEDEFAAFLAKEMQNDFDIDGNNDILELVQAYIRKNHALYENNKKIEEITKRLDNL